MNSETDLPNEKIQVAVQDGVGYARVLGRGSFKISASLKEFGATLLLDGHNRLIIDLRECIGMDPTFMGMLAGLSQRFRKDHNGSIAMTHVSPKIHGLMSTLGLIRMVEIVTEAAPMPDAGLRDLAHTPQSALESAQTMLEAHEKLVEIKDDNRLRFQDVLDYLREDIQRQRGR
jgi:anti-anti-sigma regulatory factor